MKKKTFFRNLRVIKILIYFYIKKGLKIEIFKGYQRETLGKSRESWGLLITDIKISLTLRLRIS